MACEPVQTCVDAALAEVLAAQNDDGGWGYVPGYASNTEATAVCGLALVAFIPQSPALAAAGQYLRRRRLASGALAVSHVVEQAGWASPLAGMLLARLGDEESVEAALSWLLAEPVFTVSPTPSQFYGYDTSIAGWPWTAGDYSFVEPTAVTVLFMKQQGYGRHDRVRQAVTMLKGRVLPAGGWNYGEPNVLGADLFPAVVPTAVALIGLADEPDNVTSNGLHWLAQQQTAVSSLFSLGWAAAALNIHGILDSAGVLDVMYRWQQTLSARRGPLDTGLCLLGIAQQENHPFAVNG